jgi:hypothetical protein
LLSLLVGKQFAGQFPEVLPGVIKIDDLNRAGEVLIGNIPDGTAVPTSITVTFVTPDKTPAPPETATS